MERSYRESLSEAELEKVAGGFLPIAIFGAAIGAVLAGGLIYLGVDNAIRHEW